MKTVFFKYRFQFGIGCCVLLCLCSCKRPLELREAFDKVSEIDRFEIEEYESDRYGFPESFGEAIVCVHPNSSCREKVISVLSKLPQKSPAFEAIYRWTNDPFLYCIHSLTNNSCLCTSVKEVGDAVLILFSSADLVEAKRFLSQLNGYHRSKQHT